MNNRVVVFLVLALLFFGAFAIVGNTPVPGVEAITAFRASEAQALLASEQELMFYNESNIAFFVGAINNMVAITWSLFALGLASSLIAFFARTTTPAAPARVSAQ